MERYNNQKIEEMIFTTADSKSDIEALNKLRAAQHTGEILTGFAEKCTKEGSLVVSLSDNIKGYIPREEVTYRVEKDGKVHLNRVRGRVGINVQFKVKDFVDENGEIKVILSRKDVVEEIRNRYASELKVGMVLKGIVIGMQEYGAFIDIGGEVSGVLSVGAISRVFIKHPSERLKIGQIVDVVVSDLRVDEKNNITISFSRKEILPTWDKISSVYNEGETVVGRVKEVIDTGVFVELDDSFEGLADFSPGRKFNYGDKVRVVIDYINVEKEKIKLRFV